MARTESITRTALKRNGLSEFRIRYTRKSAKALSKQRSKNWLQNYYKIKKTLKGYDDFTGTFKTRYYAKKYAKYDEVVVKVDGGYTIMTADFYNRIWKKQN